MDMYKVNKFVGDMVFGLLLISGAGIFGLSSFVAFNIFAILEKELIGALFKCVWGSEEAAVDEITATINININSNNSSLRSINNSRNRLKLKEIISHIYWYHKIAENLKFFIRAILPVQYHPDWEEYNKGIQEHDGTIIRRTPFIFKYLLNNPSETAADFAETFTRRVLSNLGFHYLSSNNDNLNYHGGYDDRIESFEQALSKSCFTRELVKRYNCIGLDNLGVPPAETRFSDFEEKVLRRFYFKPDDDEWVEPMNNWCNWYIKTIHERIFPSQDYQLFEATVKYLFFSFLHDIAAPFKSLLALLGIKTISS